MDGDGLSSKPTIPRSKLRRTTRKTASAVTFQLSRPIGHTFKASLFCTRVNSRTYLGRLVCENNALRLFLQHACWLLACSSLVPGMSEQEAARLPLSQLRFTTSL